MSFGLNPQRADQALKNSRVSEIAVATQGVFGTITTQSAVANSAQIDTLTVTSADVTDLTVTELKNSQGLFIDPLVINVRDYGAKGDGVTNDTVAFETAFAQIGTTNRMSVVWVPPSAQPYMTGGLVITKSNFRFVIDGTLKLLNQGNNQVIFLGTGLSNVTIEGLGTIDGNRDNQTVGVLGGIYGDAGITNVSIRNLRIQYCRAWPINTVMTHSLIENVYCYENNAALVIPPGSQDVVVRNVTIDGTGSDEGMVAYGHACKNVQFINCTATRCTLRGMGCLSDEAQPGAGSNISFVQCRSYSNKTGGFIVAGGDEAWQNVSFVGCESWGNNTFLGVFQQGYGMLISKAVNVSVVGCLFHDELSAPDQSVSGIFVAGVSNCLISNNIFSNIGLGAVPPTYGGYGILLANVAATNDNVSIQSNLFENTDPAHKYMQVAVFAFQNVTNSTIYSNVIRGLSASGVGDGIAGLTNLSNIRMNAGYLPPAITQPAVPASNTAVTNGNLPVTVYVSGGNTVSIKINGITLVSSLPATGLCFELQPQETITAVYNSAPTWVWVAHQ